MALVKCNASFSYPAAGGPRTIAVGELLDESDPAVSARRDFFTPTAAQQLVTAAELDPTAAASLAADPAFTATYVPWQIDGSRSLWFGDSITIGSVGDNGVTLNMGESYTTYLTLLSGGTIRHLRNAGVAGNNTNDLLARWDTDVVPLAPTAIHLRIGTNDAGSSFTLATYATNMRALLAKARGVGAALIVYSVPPVGSATTPLVTRSQLVGRYNTWLRRWCSTEGLLFIDDFKALVDPTTGYYQASLTSDGVHPSAAGQAAMATAAWAQLSPWMKPYRAPLCGDVLDQDNLLPNKLFLGGASGNGLPTGWAEYSGLQAGTTRSYVTDANVPGNLLRITQSSAASAHILTGQITGWSVNDWLELSGLLTTSGGVTAGVELTGVAGGYICRPLEAISRAVTRGVWSYLYQIPSGTTALYLMLKAGAGTGTVDYGQLAIRDLTATGVYTA